MDFNQSIDLLSLPGAKPLTINDGTAEKPNMVNYVCIPAELNEIAIDRSRADSSQLVAYLRLTMRALSQKYINAIVSDRQRRGDEVDMSRIETHEVTLNHSKDFMAAWTERVAKAVLAEHPEWNGQSAIEKSANAQDNALYFEVRRRINKRVGKSYAVQPDPAARVAAPVSFSSPAGINPFAPSASVAAGAPMPSEADVEGELPF